MKKIAISSIIILFALTSCSQISPTYEAEPTTTSIKMSATTIVLFAKVSDEAMACIPIGHANEDQTIPNLVSAGYDLAYVRGVWYFDGYAIGTASLEDEPFDACGPRSVIDVMTDHR